MKLIWNSPEIVPEVELWSEELFWIAVDSKHTGRIHTFLAHYQNRPLLKDSEDIDDCLVNVDGDPIHSVGWVDCKEHYEFDNYYSPLRFDDQYIFLGWAEYEPPEFTGITQTPEQAL